MRQFLRRLWARIGGQRAHRRVDNVIGAFETHIRALDASVAGMGAEIAHNLSHQLELEARNMELRQQRDRAQKVQAKLTDLVS